MNAAKKAEQGALRDARDHKISLLSGSFRMALLLLLMCGVLGHTREAHACKGKECYGGKAGALWFSFDSIRNAGTKERKYKIYYFHQKKCHVVGFYGLHAEVFRKAVKHLHRVLRDPFFRLLVLQKRDWQMMKGRSRTLVRKLLYKRTKIIANTFHRKANFPCQTNGLDEHTNAFAPLNVRILFISKSYLTEQHRRGRLGVRILAKTILHETLHTLGYSHRRLIAGSVSYNNTVPVFIGCMAMNWPPRRGSSKSYAQRVVSVSRYCSFSAAKMRREKAFYVPWMETRPGLHSHSSKSRW
ncbi:MAG: hypothetical protein H6728_12605 [Myxococcales bacterium]|nr:hypothetical protein [Myxococcales bacterium]